MCHHVPRCALAEEQGCCSAHVVADHSEQGWCLLCNGLVLFDDGFYLDRGDVRQVPCCV